MNEGSLPWRGSRLTNWMFLFCLCSCLRPPLMRTLGTRTELVSFTQAQSEGLQPVVLSLILNALTTNEHGKLGERSIAPGEALRSGDPFSLLVEVDRSAYLYVMQKVTSGPASGGVQLLYPRSGECRVEPGALRRVPRTGMFALDHQSSSRMFREDLFIVAVERPVALGSLHAHLAQQIKEYDVAQLTKRSLPGDRFTLRASTAPRQPQLEQGPGLLERDKPFLGAKGVVYAEIETKVDRSTGATILHFPFMHISSGRHHR